jgi:hypothetical protein
VGATSITLNAGAGGAALGVDQDGSAVDWQVVKLGYSASGTTPTQVNTANPLPAQLWDGTHGPAAVKAASTAAVGADQALVVAISPNNSVAITTAAALSVEPDGSVWTLTGTSANVALTTALPAGMNTIGAVSQAPGWLTNVSQWAGLNLAPPTGFGTSPSGLVPGVNAFITNLGPQNSANSLSVTIAADQAPVYVRNAEPLQITNDKTLDGELGTPLRIQAAFPIDIASILNPPPVTFSTAVVSGVGASASTVPRVTLSNDSRALIWDGTNGPVAVKPSGTAAQGADPALVVAFSPNSNLPAGSNQLGTVLCNITQLQSVGLQAATSYGTAPGLTNGVIPVNAFVTNTVAENITQVNGSAVSTVNPLPVLIADGGRNPISIDAKLDAHNQLLAASLLMTKLQNDSFGSGFIPMEVPPIFGVGA